MKRPEALDTLRELDKQAPHPTHVTAFRPEADPNEEVWTLSNNPDDEGWSTDGGYSGYGMTKAIATVYAEARNALPDILAYVAHLERLVQGAAPTGCVLVPEPVAHNGGLAANTAAKFLRTSEAAARGGGDANTAFIAGYQAKALEDLVDALDPDIRKGGAEQTTSEPRTT